MYLWFQLFFLFFLHLCYLIGFFLCLSLTSSDSSGNQGFVQLSLLTKEQLKMPKLEFLWKTFRLFLLEE